MGGGVEKKRGGGVGLVGVRAYEEKFQKRKRKIDYFHFFNLFFLKILGREFNKLPPPNRPTHPNKGGGGVGQFHISHSALNNLNTPALPPPPPPSPKREVLILP